MQDQQNWLGFFFASLFYSTNQEAKGKKLVFIQLILKIIFPCHTYIIFQAIQEENMNLEGTNIILRLVRFEQTHTIPALVIKLHCLQMNIKLKE